MLTPEEVCIFCSFKLAMLSHWVEIVLNWREDKKDYWNIAGQRGKCFTGHREAVSSASAASCNVSLWPGAFPLTTLSFRGFKYIKRVRWSQSQNNIPFLFEIPFLSPWRKNAGFLGQKPVGHRFNYKSERELSNRSQLQELVSLKDYWIVSGWNYIWPWLYVYIVCFKNLSNISHTLRKRIV